MTNITTFIQELTGVEYVLIDKGNGDFTSMTKEHWDNLEAEREQSGTL